MYIRSLSSGESSGLVLECANQGVPSVFNSIGALEELPRPPFFGLPENAGLDEFVQAVESVVLMDTADHSTLKLLEEFSLGRSMGNYGSEIIFLMSEVYPDPYE